MIGLLKRWGLWIILFMTGYGVAAATGDTLWDNITTVKGLLGVIVLLCLILICMILKIRDDIINAIQER